MDELVEEFDMHNPIPEEAGWLFDEYDGEDFWSKVAFGGGDDYLDDGLVDQSSVTGQCWVWVGAMYDNTQSLKYGAHSIRGKKQQAHRLAYRDFGNRLEDDQVIDHMCRNPRCVRPSHLEAVDQTTNVRRGLQPLLNRGFCRNGHEITADNLTMRKRGDKFIKACKTCLATSRHRTYLKRKAAGKA